MNVSQPGPIPPIPEPFWHRSWRTLWRWRPECLHTWRMRDGSTVTRLRRFKTRDEYERHWLAWHVPTSGDAK